MSLNKLYYRSKNSEPFTVAKTQRHHVRYEALDERKEEKDQNNNIFFNEDHDENIINHKINSSVLSSKFYIPQPKTSNDLRTTCSPSTSLSVKFIDINLNSCSSCGHPNTVIMTHLPVSPLLRSQHNLELAENSSAHRLYLPSDSNLQRVESNFYSSTPPLQPQSLQISRRPSILLQEILTTRVNGPKKDLKNNKTMGSPLLTNTNSSATVDEGAKGPMAKLSKQKNRRIANDTISSELSALYCKLLVLLGVCLPITEVTSQQIPTYVYQGFYVYLYAISILFVIFLYASAFRNRTIFSALKIFHEKNNNIHLKHKVHHFGSFYLRVGAIAFAIGTMVFSGLEFGQYFELSGQSSCQNIFVAVTPIFRTLLCIVQIQFIFLNTSYLDMARHKVTSRFGLMHMVATNLCEWLYVLVEETKHEIFHLGYHDFIGKDPSTGASNGRWILEDLERDTSIEKSFTNSSKNFQSNNNHSKDATALFGATVPPTLANASLMLSTNDPIQHNGCSRTNIMGALVQEVSPFLFPCTIEYSLICAVILYEMWKTVRSIPDIDRSRKHSMKPTAHKPAHHFSVDCSQSHRGLFFGILIIVTTIISMIMYFVLFTQPGYELIATQEVALWETVICFLCASAIIIAFFLMRDLKFVKGTIDERHSMELDNLLLIVAQTGVYLYGMFSIFGSYFSSWDTVPDRIEGIVAEVFSLIETSLQTLFILHSSHRRCKGAKQQRRKPGREIITFLLVANIAIWFMNTLIKGRAVFRETHLAFFGVWGWTIITHVSMPLAIFYRFHSTICLFEVWKVTYKAKAN